MEKLELKHIVGYFPYGLKGISTEENLGFEIVKGFSIYGKHNTVCLCTNVDYIYLILFKPILRPLSELTKEIEVNGAKFVPAKYWQSIGGNYDQYKKFHDDLEKGSIYLLPFFAVQKLYEWHFDLHNLIEKGLAIDLNTIENGIQ